MHTVKKVRIARQLMSQHLSPVSLYAQPQLASSIPCRTCSCAGWYSLGNPLVHLERGLEGSFKIELASRLSSRLLPSGSREASARQVSTFAGGMSKG